MDREDENRQLEHARRTLIHEFSGRVPQTEVERRFTEMAQQFSSAPVRNFVPVLVLRQVREQLRHTSSN